MSMTPFITIKGAIKKHTTNLPRWHNYGRYLAYRCTKYYWLRAKGYAVIFLPHRSPFRYVSTPIHHASTTRFGYNRKCFNRYGVGSVEGRAPPQHIKYKMHNDYFRSSMDNFRRLLWTSDVHRLVCQKTFMTRTLTFSFICLTFQIPRPMLAAICLFKRSILFVCRSAGH